MSRSRAFFNRASVDVQHIRRYSHLTSRPDGGAIIAQLPEWHVKKAEQRARKARGLIEEREERTYDTYYGETQDGESTKISEPDLLAVQGRLLGIKDNFTLGETLPTTCASFILRGFHAPTATAVRLLEKAGAKVLATTNMDEFGMGSHSINSAYGPVTQGVQHEREFSVGGSSGGSALAVAHNRVDLALGSDTGGSVRLPAAYTNIVGFKPSYGRISRNGLIPYANSLDTVGILAKDCSSVLEAFDDKDPTCLSRDSRLRIKNHTRLRTIEKFKEPGYERYDPTFQVGYGRAGVRKCRIGIPMEYNIAELHPLVREAWMAALKTIESQGHAITPISLPTTKQALAAYYVLAPAEASSNLAKYDGVRYGAPRDRNEADNAGGVLYAKHRSIHFGDEVKRRILLGTFSLSAGAIDNYFIQAQKVRRLVQDDFNMVFRLSHPLQSNPVAVENGVDFIICPTAPTPPPTYNEVLNADQVESYMNDVFTVPASLAGLPAISIPVPTEDGSPRPPGRSVGIQIIGQYGDDTELLWFVMRNFEEDILETGHRAWVSSRPKIT